MSTSEALLSNNEKVWIIGFVIDPHGWEVDLVSKTRTHRRPNATKTIILRQLSAVMLTSTSF
jgi:hypothetical protein